MYASPIWSPYLTKEVKRLETVQNKFLRYLDFKSGQMLDSFCHDYSQIMIQFKIPKLESRSEVNDALFAHKFVCNGIDCSELQYLLILNEC